MDKGKPGWVYVALDVESSNFGDALGELNRTGWKITGSDELPPDELLQAPLSVWQRIYAKKMINGFTQFFGP